MISLATLNPDNIRLSVYATGNLNALYVRLRELEIASDMELHVSSGVRSWERHLAIYEEINERRRKQAQKPLVVPSQSRHLDQFAAAADIRDPDHRLQKFITGHLSLVEKLELYFEAFPYTVGWVHIQSNPPGSGLRFFRPY